MTTKRATTFFKPEDHTITLQGGLYLPVSWCLVWLRSEHPDADIETSIIGYTDQAATVWAKVTIPGQGSATAHGQEEKTHFKDYLEKAETKAIGRALRALGYGAEFAGEDLAEGGPVVSPVRMPAKGQTPREVASKSLTRASVQEEDRPGPQVVTRPDTPAEAEKPSPDAVKAMYREAKMRGLSHEEFDALLTFQGYGENPSHGRTQQEVNSLRIWIQKILPAELQQLLTTAGIRGS